MNVLRPSERVSFAKGIRFQERDIAQDPGALADLKKLGYMTTPVIVVDDSVSWDSTLRRSLRLFRVSLKDRYEC